MLNSYIYFFRLSQELWTLVDQDVSLNNCSIFSYSPDQQSSPFGSDDGTIWSYCYFFYNRLKKKVLLFTGQLDSNSFNSESKFFSNKNIFTVDKL